MAFINKEWKKWLACSCSHGHLADPEALAMVLKAKERFRPHKTLHLGDYVDTAAFRRGARDTKDEGVSPRADVGQGIRFLRDLRPDVLLNGNHDIRLWKHLDHHQAIVADCAAEMVRAIEAAVPKKAVFVREYNRRAWYEFGGRRWMHGVMYNEQALRDHAEHYGNCVIGHLHAPGQARGRRSDRPVATCVGYLGKEELFDYAELRRATDKWNQAFGWGFYTEDGRSTVNLFEKGDGGWPPMPW